MTTSGKVAAVWWRVSTDDQRETSPNTQIREALALAQQEGYAVPQEYILGTDWHSLSVWDSPPMERLKEMVRGSAIGAIFMYDADRGPAKPAHRLLFRALCQDHDVSIRCRHGQVPEGEMGEVMEFLSAWSKEKQVMRAQQGARDGLRDRAVLRGLLATPKDVLGYTWDKGNPRSRHCRSPALQGGFRDCHHTRRERRGYGDQHLPIPKCPLLVPFEWTLTGP